MTYNDLECQFYVKIRFRQQGCRALTFALARLSCKLLYCTTLNSYYLVLMYVIHFCLLLESLQKMLFERVHFCVVVQLKLTAVLSWVASSGLSVTVQEAGIKAIKLVSGMMRR